MHVQLGLKTRLCWDETWEDTRSMEVRAEIGTLLGAELGTLLGVELGTLLWRELGISLGGELLISQGAVLGVVSLGAQVRKELQATMLHWLESYVGFMNWEQPLVDIVTELSTCSSYIVCLLVGHFWMLCSTCLHTWRLTAPPRTFFWFLTIPNIHRVLSIWIIERIFTEVLLRRFRQTHQNLMVNQVFFHVGSVNTSSLASKKINRPWWARILIFVNCAPIRWFSKSHPKKKALRKAVELNKSPTQPSDGK